jgi:hypothetical protein
LSKEIRYLLLTRDEVLEAALDFHRAMSPPPHFGIATAVKFFSTDDGIEAEVKLGSMTDNRTLALRLAPQKLLSAIIKFCNKRRIPLPAKAFKCFQILEGGQLAMLMMLGIDSEVAAKVGRAAAQAPAK